MILDKDHLEDVRAGCQKVANSGQWGSTFYIFAHGDKIIAVNNKNLGIGELVEVITKQTPDAPVAEPAELGFGRHEPADYSVQYEGTSKP